MHVCVCFVEIAIFGAVWLHFLQCQLRLKQIQYFSGKDPPFGTSKVRHPFLLFLPLRLLLWCCGSHALVSSQASGVMIGWALRSLTENASAWNWWKICKIFIHSQFSLSVPSLQFRLIHFCFAVGWIWLRSHCPPIKRGWSESLFS